MNFGKIFKGAFVAALAALVMTTAVSSVQASEDQIKFRKTVMKGQGATMGALAAVVKGKANAKNAAGLAAALAALSRVAPGIFPKGSAKGKTRAKAEIWSKPKEFKAAVMAFQKASANLAKVAKGGNAGAIKKAFGGVGKSCGGCHKAFRKPKKK